jgi:spermidine synthase
MMVVVGGFMVLLTLLLSVRSGVEAQTAAFPDSLVFLEESETPYNNVFIYRRGDTILMRFKRLGKNFNESVIYPENPLELAFPHYKLMHAGLLYVDEPESLLMIGLGGGTTSRYLHHHMPALKIEAVELDPGVISAAGKYFGAVEDSTYSITATDGRIFLIRNRALFDIIVVDAYRGGYIPFHLTTQEFYKLLKSRLKEGGCMVANLNGRSRLFDSSLRTLGSVFDEVDTFTFKGNNVIAVCYMGTRRNTEELTTQAALLQEKFAFHHDIEEIVARRYVVKIDPDAMLLTDDFSPANYLNAIGRHNQPLW